MAPFHPHLWADKTSECPLLKINGHSITFPMTGKNGYLLSISELGSRGKDAPPHPPTPASVLGSTPGLVHNNREGKIDLHGSDLITEPASVGDCICHTRGGSWIGIYLTLPGDCSWKFIFTWYLLPLGLTVYPGSPSPLFSPQEDSSRPRRRLDSVLLLDVRH